ncbi:MAG: hypothetical protein IKW04_00625 [Clostridia bacterium]|nr:hypothetical protein [Clostridia bacterium]
MDFKKIGKSFLFPHVAIMLILVPVSMAFLVYSLIFLASDSIVAVLSYVLSFYTLTVWCLKIPYLIAFVKVFRAENQYVQVWKADARLRVNISLYGTLIFNTVYAIFQMGLGFYHHTFWYYSLAGYYFSLAVMRFFLLRHSRKHNPGEKMREELVRYRACGILFLMMNLALSLMIFFMVRWNRTFHHHEITTIAMAAYTFTSFTIAIINLVKYRKYESPIFSASKAISLASACVSMLTLESTMLTTFNDGSMNELSRNIFLGVSGGVISVFVIAMAIHMICESNKKLKQIKKGQEV